MSLYAPPRLPGGAGVIAYMHITNISFGMVRGSIILRRIPLSIRPRAPDEMSAAPLQSTDGAGRHFPRRGLSVGNGLSMMLSVPAASPLNRLPTLQRNALRKLFERPEFTPEEVANVGYRRLQRAEGIGQKGLATIQAWLRDYGFEVRPDPQPSLHHGKRLSRYAAKDLESAMRVVQAHGYVVQRTAGDLSSE